MDPHRFIRRNTAIAFPPLAPEIRLHLASEITPIWQASEETLARGAVPPPFWAFAWAGGQALARYLLDHPQTVAGRKVLDFGSGSGLVAIAAAMAGARSVVAAEIDHFAAAAIAANAALNHVAVEVTTVDVLGAGAPGWQTVTAGDVCYEREMAERVVAWLRVLAGAGSMVLLGDPGRAYLPRSGLRELACYQVPTSRESRMTTPARPSSLRCWPVDGWRIRAWDPDRLAAHRAQTRIGRNAQGTLASAYSRSSTVSLKRRISAIEASASGRSKSMSTAPTPRSRSARRSATISASPPENSRRSPSEAWSGTASP